MFATMIIQPIDTLKVQIQVISEQLGKSLQPKDKSIFQIARVIHQKQGFKVLYRGLDSAILRQLFYASARLGSYTWAIEMFQKNGAKIGTL